MYRDLITKTQDVFIIIIIIIIMTTITLTNITVSSCIFICIKITTPQPCFMQ